MKNEDFLEFYNKYGIMYRENLFRGLKNLTRQRRSYNRYFEDLQILMGEATHTDNLWLKLTKQ